MEAPQTFSETVPETSETFCVATSPSFFPAYVIRPVHFEAPVENTDQLYKIVGVKRCIAI